MYRDSCLSVFVLVVVLGAHAELASGAHAAGAAIKGSVFVMPVVTTGRATNLEDLEIQLSETIAATLVRRRDLSVITNVDVDDVLSVEMARRSLSCKESEECLTRLREITDADYILSASVGRLGREILLTVSLIHAHEARVVGREAANATSARAVLGALPGLLGRLFSYGRERDSPFELPETRGVKRIGVFGLKSTGVSPSDVNNLAQFLAVELSRVRNTEVISPEDIEAILGKQAYADVFDSECTEECLARISGALNVTYLVTGLVGSLSPERGSENKSPGDAEPREYIISLKLIDQKEVRVVNRKIIAFRGPKEELKRAIRTVARDLMGVTSKLGGTLAVSGPVIGSEVFVEGKLIGTLPVEPIDSYAPGRVHVRIQREGYFTWASDVFVQPGEGNVTWADQIKKPSSWYTKWWVWTIVGAVVAGGVTAAALALDERTPSSGRGDLCIGTDC